MKSFAVIGLGRFGTSLSTTLYEMGHEVLCIDENPDHIKAIEGSVTHAIQADASDPAVLSELGIRNFDTVVVSIGAELETAILITLLCKEQGCRCIVAKAATELHAKILSKIGADKVVLPEKAMGVRFAHSLAASNVLDFTELAPGYSMAEIDCPEAWQNKTLMQLNLRARFGITVIAIRHGRDMIASPCADDLVQAGDVLIVVGKNDRLTKLESKHLQD